MARDINLGPTGGPFVNIQENSGDLDITGATDVDLNGANLTNAGITEGFDTIDVFTADGTFDASNVDKLLVEVVGGGGGAGAFDATTETFGTSGGGGGGGYARAIKDVSNTTSISVTVGSGGAGGTGTSNGSAGGDSIFDTTTQVIGNGGGGGASAPTGSATSSGGSGGGGQGDVVVSGQPGGSGDSIDTAVSQDVFSITSSEGGDSVYGHGAEQQIVVNDILSGVNGNQYGGGGGAPINADGSTFGSSPSSGSGAQGIVIVRY
jgi:hypothetical protein